MIKQLISNYYYQMKKQKKSTDEISMKVLYDLYYFESKNILIKNKVEYK